MKLKLIGYCGLALVVVASFGCQQGTTNVSTAPAPVSEENTTVASDDPPQAAPEEFLIDVRSQEEWDGGHLSEAIHIPHTDISERIAEVTDDKSAKLVLY